MLLPVAAGSITDTHSLAGSVVTHDARIRRLAMLAALNVVAVGIYVLVAAQMGFFNHLSASLFWSPDSQTYRAVAHWLLGSGPSTLESTHRTFLYPLLLGLAEKIGGDPAIWALNFVCWVGMVNATALATLRLTGRQTIAGIVFLVLVTNASLIVLSMQALTEMVTAFLLSLWILGLALSKLPPARPRDVAMLLLPISLLTVIRPQFEVQLGIALILLAITLWRLRSGRVLLASVAAACCFPVMFQVALMATTYHMFGISQSGDAELKLYYVSQVYATINGLPDDLTASRSVVGGWSTSQALTYLVDHPWTAANILITNLHRNLTSGSNFVDPTGTPVLADLIRSTNRTYLKIHALFLPIVALAIWRRRDARLALLYLFAGLVTLLPSLIVDQGDRYVEVALPLWIAAYGLAVADLLPDVSRAVGRLRGARAAGV